MLPSHLIGRRLPDATMGEPGAGWDAWRDRQPGDYMRVRLGPGVRWYICDPLGRVGMIGGQRITLEPFEDGELVRVLQPPPVEPWTITEHDDGSITVRPSIMDPGGWHGYLEHGEWRVA